MGILRNIRRAMHPARAIKSDIKRSVKRAVVPKPIRKLEAQTFKIAHPIEAMESAAFRATDQAVTSALTGKGGRKRQATKTTRSPVTTVTTGGTRAYVVVKEAFAPSVSLGVADLVEQTGYAESTIRASLAYLVKDGYLVSFGRATDRRWTRP